MWFDCVERKRSAKLPSTATALCTFAVALSFQACLHAFIFTFCVCVCIYMYLCMCADMYICIHMHVCMYLYIYAFIHMCMCMCMHGQVCMFHRCVFTPTYTSANTLAAGCAHMCIRIYVCICMHMHMDAYVRL